MNLDQYHDSRLEYYLPAVNPDHQNGDPIYVARGVAFMWLTADGSAVEIRPDEGSPFRPLSAEPFLEMIVPIASSPDNEGNIRRSYSLGFEPLFFDAMVQEGECLVLDPPISFTDLEKIDAEQSWISWQHHIEMKKPSEH